MKDVGGVLEKFSLGKPSFSRDDSLVLDDIGEQLAFEGKLVRHPRSITDEVYDDELTAFVKSQTIRNYFPSLIFYFILIHLR
ncbi:MAG: hypothetical protein IPN88_16360 [Bacteroidetes bacterium]|nr:hypothetical protein [Bacteroidota bacterium]